MCNKISDAVKIYAWFDLFLTLFTVIVIIYVYVSNRELVDAEQLEDSQRRLYEREMGIYGFGKTKNIWRVLVVSLIICVLGITLCVCIVLFAGFFAETKSPTLGLWLIFQIMTIVVLTCLWAYFCYFVVIDHDSVVAGPTIQIPVAFCYFSRLLLVLLIWLKRRKYAREIEMEVVVPVPVET